MWSHLHILESDEEEAIGGMAQETDSERSIQQHDHSPTRLKTLLNIQRNDRKIDVIKSTLFSHVEPTSDESNYKQSNEKPVKARKATLKYVNKGDLLCQVKDGQIILSK